ncbi:MAG: hypothetical protein AB7F89_01140 [Pirellulaceae bacterium]
MVRLTFFGLVLVVLCVLFVVLAGIGLAALVAMIWQRHRACCPTCQGLISVGDTYCRHCGGTMKK